jgi:pimeloyl-ACP methyl ester carboxylesterase
VGQIIGGRLFPEPDQADLRREFVKRWAQNDRQAYVWSVDAIMGWSVMERLPSLSAPTLLVAAEHDYTPVTTKNRIAARIPNARVAVVDDARHALPVEKPDVFNALVEDFLTQDVFSSEAE